MADVWSIKAERFHLFHHIAEQVTDIINTQNGYYDHQNRNCYFCG